MDNDGLINWAKKPIDEFPLLLHMLLEPFLLLSLLNTDDIGTGKHGATLPPTLFTSHDDDDDDNEDGTAGNVVNVIML
jgi:hypothetical protein